MATSTQIQNKVRPGVYIEFDSAPEQLSTVSDRGIVSLALPLSWGAVQELVKIEAGENVQEKLGYTLHAKELLLVREALKRARTVLVYRLNSGAKAQAVIGDVQLSARYAGLRGNDLLVSVQEVAGQQAAFEVITLLDGQEVDRQSVAAAAELQDNAYVQFVAEETAVLEATAGVPLTGGTNQAASVQAHEGYMAALELQDFHTLAYTGDDLSLKELYADFVRRIRETEGKRVQLVMAGYPQADYEGVISVKNGVKLQDGTVLTAGEAAAWVAGATAGSRVNQSLTYQAYDGAIDAEPRYTNSQTIEALQAGELLFTVRGNSVVVEQDINSLTSFTINKAKHFGKNRVVRVLDGIAGDLKRLFETTFIGKVNNDSMGRAIFKTECVSYLESLESIGAIQNFDSQKDVAVLPGDTNEAIVLQLAVQPTDSVEKIYMNVEVR